MCTREAFVAGSDISEHNKREHSAGERNCVTFARRDSFYEARQSRERAQCPIYECPYKRIVYLQSVIQFSFTVCIL